MMQPRSLAGNEVGRDVAIRLSTSFKVAVCFFIFVSKLTLFYFMSLLLLYITNHLMIGPSRNYC